MIRSDRSCCCCLHCCMACEDAGSQPRPNADMQPKRNQSLTFDGEGLARLLERAPRCPTRLHQTLVAGTAPHSRSYLRPLRGKRDTSKSVHAWQNQGGNGRHGAVVATPAHSRTSHCCRQPIPGGLHSSRVLDYFHTNSLSAACELDVPNGWDDVDWEIDDPTGQLFFFLSWVLGLLFIGWLDNDIILYISIPTCHIIIHNIYSSTSTVRTSTE